VTIPLAGYETAVFEVYPVDRAGKPLLAGVTFDVLENAQGKYRIKAYEAGGDVRLLNPGPGNRDIDLPAMTAPQCLESGIIVQKGSRVDIQYELAESVDRAALAMLFTPEGTSAGFELKSDVLLDGQNVKYDMEEQEGGSWRWLKIDVPAGKHKASLDLESGKKGWKGGVSIWMICDCRPDGREIRLDAAPNPKPRPSLPKPYPQGVLRRNAKIGDILVK
jgi:hypothetical protein